MGLALERLPLTRNASLASPSTYEGEFASDKLFLSSGSSACPIATAVKNTAPSLMGPKIV